MGRKWKPEHKELATKEQHALIYLEIDARFVSADARRATVIGSADLISIEGVIAPAEVDLLWKCIASIRKRRQRGKKVGKVAG